MKKIIKTMNCLSLLFVWAYMMFISIPIVEASADGVTGFTYNINFPDNQIDKNVGYFNLKMSAGQKQIISISLSNPSTEKMMVNFSLNGAKTNQNGVIEYGDSDIENDPSLAFEFEKIVTGPESIELAPGETKEVEFTIQMPKTGIKGVLAGGIQLMKADQTGTETENGGSKIINQYAYVVGVLLQESEERLLPDLKLNSVSAGQNNYRNTIFINFSNIIAGYVNDMTIETQITAKGSETVLFERKQTAMRMAPNSFINFPISMNGEKMNAGKYKANILVTSGDKNWKWSQEFEITEKEANKFNERDVELVQEKSFDWKLIMFIVLSVLTIIGLIFLMLMLSRKIKQTKEPRIKGNTQDLRGVDTHISKGSRKKKR